MATSIAPIAPVDPPVIKAAGGILQRSTPKGEEVMVVYRKRHQDWTLPRGKVKDGESFQEAAMREVKEETGCTCKIGNYLGTISYSDDGVPKVVLFWKMSVLAENSNGRNQDEIGEAAWLPIAAAVEKLSYAQEKTLLSRVSSNAMKESPAKAEAIAPIESFSTINPLPIADAGPAKGNNRAYTRLLRECEAFRVELGFLERRSGQASNFWAAAAHEQLNNVQRSLAANDIEGGWFCLHAAQRYAVYGMNAMELANRAQVLREEAVKITSWRGAAMENLLAANGGGLTAEQVADAMALRNEDSTNQYYKTRLTGDQLRILLISAGIVAVALAPLMLLSGRIPMVAAVLFFGLLGSTFCAAQALIFGRIETRIANHLITLTPVLFGVVASLAGYGIHEYMSALTFHGSEKHISAVLGLAFLFGCLGQRLLARIATGRKRKARV